MNARQKKFAEYYAQCGNTVQSAIKAGYSEAYANSTACKLLENARVAEYLKSLSEKASKERILTAIERQAMLSDIAKKEYENQSDRIKAIDTLNKMTGEYIDRVELSGEVNTNADKLDKILEQLNE
jgi:phage terminase small subunit